MGHKSSGKVLVPRVVSMVEELMIMLRRPHVRVRPHKWHTARGGSAVEKKLQSSERVSPDMTGGMVASHIQCIPPNLLAAFMWRRLLNNATLAAATHKGFGKVSNGTSTRVVD